MGNTYTVKIGGSTVNVYAGGMSVQNQLGQRSTGTLAVWANSGVYWQYGTAVQVYDERDTLLFSGFTSKDKLSKGQGARQGDGNPVNHAITLMDNCYKADKRRVFKSYLNTTAGAIVTDLYNTYLAPEGVTITSSSIASGPTIVMVVENGTKSVAEMLTWLATQAGYWWQIDANNVLWFQPYGGVPAPFILDLTQVDAEQTLTVEYGNDMYVNKQYAKGAFTEKGSKKSPLVEQFHGNGLTRSFTLSYAVSTLYQLLLNGSDITTSCLTKGQSGGQFYYASGDAVLAQDTAYTLLGTGDTLEVHYTGRIPVIASAQNPTLIANQKAREGGGTGLVESVYSNSKVKTLAAAFQIASSLLAHYGQDAVVAQFSTWQKGLAPGQMLTVNAPDFGLTNQQMLISSVTISDQNDQYNIYYDVTCVGSPVEMAQWQTFWQGLMNQSNDPSDFSDTSDTSLATVAATTLTRTPTVTVTHSKALCPFPADTLYPANTLTPC